MRAEQVLKGGIVYRDRVYLFPIYRLRSTHADRLIQFGRSHGGGAAATKLDR